MKWDAGGAFRQDRRKKQPCKLKVMFMGSTKSSDQSHTQVCVNQRHCIAVDAYSKDIYGTDDMCRVHTLGDTGIPV